MLQSAWERACEETVSTPLIMTLLESCGYLQDQGWQQTAQLMKVAAAEIELLNQRIADLEKHLHAVDAAHEALRTPQASNQNAVRALAKSSLR